MGDISTNTERELLRLWETTTDMASRDEIFREMEEKNLFPSQAMNTWELEAGLYPDSSDPRFIEKLMKKQEFIEDRQEGLRDQQRLEQLKPSKNLCNTDREFELTSVQRFVSRFMSPQCPYRSALLFHGVGVGKTCAAIVTAEEQLCAYPNEQVFIVAPRNIQPGFRRTIFDEESLVIPASPTEANTANGCTGDTYIKHTDMEHEKDRATIVRRISQSINQRYKIFGYIQFANYIQEIIDSVKKTDDPVRNKQEQTKALRRIFDGRLLIIDEAHNLRDAPGETKDDNLDATGAELSEAAEGKRLTPSLVRLVTETRGMKLMLLTGTPMYNNYREIIFLFKLLLLNDKKAPLDESLIFNKVTGIFRKGDKATGKKSGQEILGNVASAYMSFMRGENPLTFPVRLQPEGLATLPQWPDESPQGEPLPSDEESVRKRERILMKLPFVPVNFEGDELGLVREIADRVIASSGGLGLESIDEMVQSGNWLFPPVEEDTDSEHRIRDTGFKTVFQEKKEGATMKFTSRIEPATWLTRGPLKNVSPKADLILNRIPKAKGVIFIYSRFIRSGALPMALALEANGYSPWGLNRPLLGNAQPGGKNRQCALCESKERDHKGKSHAFAAATYVLLTGQVVLSPNNSAAIKAARGKDNLYGKNVKVVIGSQVASEGIDLRFVREIYVFDSWFHLNKMEQVLGRGVRTCSHSLLPPAERNCTIHLLVNTYGPESNTETADLYMYRNAMSKALQIGRVTRVLKQYALDCNLNLSANYISDLDPIDRMEDSQGGIRRDVDLNDTPYSSICDWTECEYSCATSVDLKKVMDEKKVDMSTYDEYAMRWRESQIKQRLKEIFEEQETPNVERAALIDQLSASGIPNIAINTLLAEIVDNQSFRLHIGRQEGYIIYRNGFYLFQPILLADVRIPLALRVADVPVGRDEYNPMEFKYVPKLDELEEAAPTVSMGPSTLSGAIAEPTVTKKEAPVAGVMRMAIEYWKATIAWAKQIRDGERILDIPPEFLKIMKERYSGDANLYSREYNVLVMISWMYENILDSADYGDDKKVQYRGLLADILLEIIWDESILASEQIRIVLDPANTSDELKKVTDEQRIQQGGTSVFRYVNTTSGGIEYMCDKKKCSEAVVRVLESDKTDPLNVLQANSETTGKIYGFIIPKIKEGRLVLKTSDISLNPIPKGSIPPKGKECENVSTTAQHKLQLEDIGKILDELGYPRFLLVDAVLNEKKQRGKAEPVKGGEVNKLHGDRRKFQNSVKHCALKNIILRLMDKLQRGADGAKRYFYRPIATLKTKHKLK